VASFKGADVYYRPGYLNAVFRRQEGEPVLFYCEKSCGRGFHVALIRDLSNLDFDFGSLGNFVDLCTPYGYGGPVMHTHDERNAAAFFEQWSRAARELGAVSEFIRFHPVLKTHRFFDQCFDTRVAARTVAIDLGRSDAKAGFSRTCQKNIETALKKGVEIDFAPSDDIGRFIRLYEMTMERREAREYYRFAGPYFRDLAEGLGDDLWVVLATHEGKDVAGALILRHGPYIHYHLGGSDYDYRSLCATNLLLARVARRGREMGISTFHLGGGYQPGDGLFRFKSGFSSVHLDFHVGRIVFDEKTYSQLARRRKDVGQCDEDFFPIYRSPEI